MRTKFFKAKKAWEENPDERRKKICDNQMFSMILGLNTGLDGECYKGHY